MLEILKTAGSALTAQRLRMDVIASNLANSEATSTPDGGPYKRERVVFVKVGDKVKMQKVETGIADNTYIEIKSGVKPGDEIVSGSYTAISRKLKDGAKITIDKQAKG